MRSLAVHRGGRLEVVEVGMPAFGDCEALVKTLSCGVCNGTDQKLIHGTFKNMEDYPMLLGHEGVGRVVEVGKKAASLKVGDVVLLPFVNGPIDGYHSGWGAYSEYAVVGDAAAFAREGKGPGTPGYSQSWCAQTPIALEGGLDAVAASMIVTFREVLSAMRRFGIRERADVVVLGGGPVGQCMTLFARLLGAHTVVTVDRHEEKLAQARGNGADAVLHSGKQDVAAEVRRLMPDGADFVIDAVGSNALLDLSMRLVKDNGSICAYGIAPEQSMHLDWSRAPYNWHLRFVQMPSKLEEYEAHSQVMAWIGRGIVKPMDFISDVIPFGDILSAFDLLENKKPTTQKIVIDYEQS